MRRSALLIAPSIDAILFAVLIASYASLILIPVFDSVNVTEQIAPVLVFGIGAYWLIDGRQNSAKGEARGLWVSKLVVIFAAIGIIVVLPTILAILARSMTAPHRFAHDGLIQTEIAATYALEGKNPYAEDYVSTAMSKKPFLIGTLDVNPALFHYPYLPFTFLAPLPLHAVARSVEVQLDHRVVYLVAFLAAVTLSQFLTSSWGARLSLLIVLGLSPLFVPFLIEGRNDILVLLWILLSIFFAQRKRFLLGTLALALACTTKQLAWPLVPFYFLYMAGDGSLRVKSKRLIRPTLLFVGCFSLIILPWLLMDPKVFIADTLAYHSGLGAHGYPIFGIGISNLLLRTGLIATNTDPYPFWLFQLAIGLPLFLVLIRRQWIQNNLRTALANYGALLFTIMFFSRSFNDNHLGFVIAILAISIFVGRASFSKADLRHLGEPS